MSDLKKDVIANLRAIIISCKGGLPLVDVQNDYLEAFGKKVPIKDLGYNSLRDLLENHPSEFYIFGDKVDAVTKSNSAHIQSLVSRQKSKTRSARHTGHTKEPKKRPLRTYTKPSKLNKENSFSVTKEQLKRQDTEDAIERITLRKPKDCCAPELAELALFSGKEVKTPSTSPENAKLKSSVKTEANTKMEKPAVTPTAPELSTNKEYTDTFENITDLPIRNSAQSRFLRHGLVPSKDLKSPNTDEGSTDSAKPLEAKERSFNVKSVSSAPSPSLHGKDFSTSQKEFEPNKYNHQKAQARIAHLQKSMQALMQNMNLPTTELNNNKADNPNLKIESSVAPSNKSTGQSENSTNKGHQMDPSQTKSGNDDGNFTCGRQEKDLTCDNLLYIIKLKELCNARGFMNPTYKLVVREQINEPKQYICKVQVEDYLQMSSYPLETLDPLSAKELAAKKMYEYCITEETFRKKNEDEGTLISRILNIVSSTYSVWSDKLPILYSNFYKEKIPDNWFDVASKSDLFVVENFNDNLFIIREKSERSLIDVKTIKRLREIQTRELESQILPVLETPKVTYWEIFITNINNSDELWCRLIGEKYSDVYDAMMTKLELEPPERKSTEPKIGGFYCIKVSAIWFRIKLTEWVNDNQGLVFFIDIGDKDVVNLSDLYEPEKHYFSVAPQAIPFSMHELGCFSDDDELTSFITNKILGHSYIGEVVTGVSDIRRGDRRLFRLWDTSTNHDVNINEILLENIVKNIIPPSLPSTSQIKEVTVTAVSDNGDIHVQTDPKSIQRLNSIILNTIQSLGDSYSWRKTDNTIGTDILYLSKCERSGNFCRVKLTEIQNSTVVDVVFIDYGFVQRKEVSDLILLEKASVLQAIPAQALKVKLGNVMSLGQSTVEKLRESILNEKVLMKVIDVSQDSTPSVEFFKRSSAGSTLYSVNMKIKSDPDLKDINPSPRRKSVVVGLEKVLPKNLPAPDLPEIGQHFQVFVTLASSPDLFIVQPLSSRTQLMKMMNELQQTFGGNFSPMKDVTVGELYAVLHPDGNWYRGCIQAMIGSNNYTVYICDFGDRIMVTKDKLQPLPEKFKTFPYQAIRATLEGIPREQRYWGPSECITFYKLVVEKCFVSTLMEITRDEKNPNFVNLGLILTDTTGEEDIYIHKVLMDKKNEGSRFMTL